MNAIEKRIQRETLMKLIAHQTKTIQQADWEYQEWDRNRKALLKQYQDELNKLNESAGIEP